MTPTTPTGRGTSSALAGRNHFDTPARRGRIQSRPSRSAHLSSARQGNTSAIWVSMRDRWPKSAAIASSIAASWRSIKARSR